MQNFNLGIEKMSVIPEKPVSGTSENLCSHFYVLINSSRAALP